MNTIINHVAYEPALFSAQESTVGKGKKVAEEVESLFLYQLLKEMDKTIMRDEESIFYSSTEETYRSLYYEEIARELSRDKGIGIKALVEDEIKANTQDEGDKNIINGTE